MSEFFYDAAWRSPLYLWVNYPKTMVLLTVIVVLIFLVFDYMKK